MEIEPTVTFRKIRTPAALETDIRKRLSKLETLIPEIIGAHVLVEQVARHHREGKRWRVRIEVSLPGERIVVTHVSSLRPDLRAREVERTHKQDEADAAGHKYAKVAVREGFETARRQLQDYVRRRRGAPKTEAARRKPLRQPRARP
ncbi:MAG: hypothetical protein IT179_02150 [Acidobacteria bacterium]|nr:hypothetical protein [Acidobacteriota bacterium]